MKDAFEQDGFLVLNHFIEPMVCDLLIERAQHLIQHFNPTSVKTIFSTHSQIHAKQQYFLDSGDKIRFFFEEKAFNEDGELKQDKLLSINKIGHALHDLDPIFNCFSRQHNIATLVTALGLEAPLLLQSMYICKQPHIGGEVTCHQDSTYLYVEEKPVMGLWFALEDATVDNGCLWVLPQGHRHALKSRMRRDSTNHVCMDVFDDSPWDLNAMIPLEVSRGSLVVLHGLLPHMSKENTSASSRHAYSLHVISGKHHYPEDNWLQRPKTNPLRGFKGFNVSLPNNVPSSR